MEMFNVLVKNEKEMNMGTFRDRQIAKVEAERLAKEEAARAAREERAKLAVQGEGQEIEKKRAFNIKGVPIN